VCAQKFECCEELAVGVAGGCEIDGGCRIPVDQRLYRVTESNAERVAWRARPLLQFRDRRVG